MLRVLIDVDDLADGHGWRVQASAAGLAQEYEMDAVVTEDGGWPRRFPKLPEERAPGDDDLLGKLCRGDAAEILGLMTRLRSRTSTADDVLAYGRWLFKCLLEPVWEAIGQLPGLEQHGGLEIALRWRAAASDLHRLVWESMHDGTGPLAGHPTRFVGITRVVRDANPAAPTPTITEVPRLLFAAGPELYDATIRPGAMYMGLLQGLDGDGSCIARAAYQCSLDDLREACTEFKPHAVHLVAHGVLVDGERGALVLGSGDPVEASDLVAAATAGGELRSIVLSACNTGTPGDPADPADASPLAAQLVAAGVPVVSAMAGEISEPACRLYTRQLVAALLDGRSMVEASAHGRRAALTGAAHTNGDIDWALPTLFLADSTDPSLKVVDAQQARHLASIGSTLKLRQEPIFIGRKEVMRDADRLFNQQKPIGVMAILCSTDTSRLGGTRLLKEIGWRLLRAGHVPLLLGPYSAAAAPSTMRGFVYEVLKATIEATQRLNITAFAPLSLESDPGGEPLASRIAGQNAVVARTEIRKDLFAFGKKPDELAALTVAEPLSADLQTLASAAASEAGPPFGAHTRVVLLCDDVHNWGDALSGLLDMLTAAGLGQEGHSIPVIFTGSSTKGAGARLDQWRATHGGQPGFRVHPLEQLETPDKVLGYQWVLLHPWSSPPDERFSQTYTFKREVDVGGVLGAFPGVPTFAADQLYVFVDAMASGNLGVVRNDDTAAFKRYAETHGYNFA